MSSFQTEPSSSSRPSVEGQPRHAVRRVRHTLKPRHVVVQSVEHLTPHMVRVTFHGPDLADFPSVGFDDHIKLILPRMENGTAVFPAFSPEGRPTTQGGEPVSMRDYTPRRFDRAALTLDIDFAIHEAGPATAWALQAQPGQEMMIGGPKGSFVVPDDFDWYLLMGDETALPAIGRRLGTLPPPCHRPRLRRGGIRRGRAAVRAAPAHPSHLAASGWQGGGHHRSSRTGPRAHHLAGRGRLLLDRLRDADGEAPAPDAGGAGPAGRVDPGLRLLEAWRGQLPRRTWGVSQGRQKKGPHRQMQARIRTSQVKGGEIRPPLSAPWIGGERRGQALPDLRRRRTTTSTRATSKPSGGSGRRSTAHLGGGNVHQLVMTLHIEVVMVRRVGVEIGLGPVHPPLRAAGSPR